MTCALWVVPVAGALGQTALGRCRRLRYVSSDSLCRYARLAQAQAPGPDARLLADYYADYSIFLRGYLDSASRAVSRTMAEVRDPVRQHEAYAELMQLQVGILIRAGRYKEAVNASLHYLPFAERTGDTLSELIFHYFVGVAYMKLLQQPEALTSYRKALAVSHDPSFWRRYPFVYGNLGITFAALNEWDSAEWYMTRAIACERDSQNLSALAGALPALGALYLETNRPALAGPAFSESLRVAERLDDPYRLIASLIGYAAYARASAHYAASIDLCRKAIDLIRRYRLTGRLPDTYQTLCEDYRLTGDYENYAWALERYMAVRDSVSRGNPVEDVANIRMQSDLQKKKNLILRRQYEVGRKDLWMAAGFALSAAIVLFSFFLSRANRARRRVQMELMQTDEQFEAEAD